jgi:hypothetical protein
MPHLLIRGVGPEQIRSVSRELTEELSAICGCPRGDFLLEVLHTTAVSADGELADSYPFIEVAWFDRGPAVQDRFAQAVDRHIREALGLPELEIAFRAYRERDYYAGGVSFGSEPGDSPSAGEELEELRESNRKLAEELRKARKALASASGGGMSTRLRDALRE